MLTGMFMGTLPSQGGGGGGSSYTALTLTSPTYTTGKFGQGLSGGTGTATITPVGGTCSVGFWIKCTGNDYGTILQIQGLASFGKAFNGAELQPDGGSQGLSNTTAPSTASGVPVINDGVPHWIYLDRRDDIARVGGCFGSWWVDGNQVSGSMQYSNQSNTLTFNVGPANFASGCVIDDLTVWNGVDGSRATPPSAAITRDANTNVIWHLDGNGLGS